MLNTSPTQRKELRWCDNTRKVIKSFPDEARNIAGNQLWQVQIGREPQDWKAMNSIGPGAIEIRIHKPHEYRVIYVAKFPEAIYVLHAFAKKTNRTPQTDLNQAKAAYAKIQQEIRKQ